MSQVDQPLRGRRRQPAPASAPLRARLFGYILVFVTIVLVVDALVGDKGLLETMRARRQYAELARSLQSLRADNERLREGIRRLREDPAAIESAARSDLGLIRPGEVVFVIKDIKGAER